MLILLAHRPLPRCTLTPCAAKNNHTHLQFLINDWYNNDASNLFTVDTVDGSITRQDFYPLGIRRRAAAKPPVCASVHVCVCVWGGGGSSVNAVHCALSAFLTPCLTGDRVFPRSDLRL